MLGSYQRSLLAILLAQFTKKRFSGGMAGVVRLASSSQPVQVHFLLHLTLIKTPKPEQFNTSMKHFGFHHGSTCKEWYVWASVATSCQTAAGSLARPTPMNVC